MRPEERKMLESLAKKTVRRREEAEILKEELNSALDDIMMNKAENLKKLDLDEAESNDTSPDAKKMKKGMAGPIIELAQGWNQVQEGITKLQNILEGLPDEKPFTSQEYMKQYTTIYNMCMQDPPYGYSKELYEKYKETFEEYLNSTVWPSLRDKHHEFLLRELQIRWNNHKVMTRWVSHFFYYLECQYITKFSLPLLNDVALACFRDLAFNKVIRLKVTNAIISLIHKEREGEQIDPSLLKNAIDIYIEIGVHEEDFETYMLDDTSTYYRRKAANWIKADSCPDYMLKAEESLKRERYRAGEAGYLNQGTLRKLVETVQDELLVTYATQLLEKENSGCDILLRNDKVEDLSRMYILYHEIQGMQLFANVFKKHVIGEGTTLVQQVEEASSSQAANKSAGKKQAIIVGKIIELHDKYMGYVKDCFMNNNVLHKSLKGAFEVLCNKRVACISSSELVATFCDNILKKGGGSERLSDEAINKTLEKVVYLIVYIHDKDLFAEFYRKRFTRRLLYDRSANEDHEKNFLGKLKQQFGANYTSKMEGMMTDLAIAKDTQRSFEEYLHENPLLKPGIDLSVSVLTTGFWPTYKSCSMKLPLEMVKCVEVFNGYYSSKTKHRRLSWVFSLGTCNIYGNFQKKTVELIVSTYQAATLLLFNNVERLSFSEIMTQLDLDHEDLVRILHSLSCGKYKILSKEPNTKTISQNDMFEFNSRFTDPMRRIKIPLPPIDDKRKVVEDVDKDRKFAIDAAIVGIMKSKKVLGHQQLVLQCVEKLSRTFKPNPKVIKMRIHSFISQDYLERDPDDFNTYRYVV